MQDRRKVALEILAMMALPFILFLLLFYNSAEAQQHWPQHFGWTNIEGFEIPVRLKVARFIMICNMNQVMGKGIDLEQTQLNVYKGCSVPIRIRSNFNFLMGTSLRLTPQGRQITQPRTRWTALIRDLDCRTTRPFIPAGAIVSRKVYVQLNSPSLGFVVGDAIRVADVVIQVRSAP